MTGEIEKKCISQTANFEDYKCLLENLNPQIKDIMENTADVSGKITKSFTDAANSIRYSWYCPPGIWHVVMPNGKRTKQIQDIEIDKNLKADIDDIQSAEES